MEEAVILSLIGLQASRRTQFASATLLLYEHAINLPDEIKHFWSGPWTISRAMYLCIRYLGFIDTVILTLGETLNVKQREVPLTLVWQATVLIFFPLLSTFLVYGAEVAIMVLCQAAITIRVWYMFAHRPVIRNIVILVYILTTLAASLLAGFLWPYVRAAGALAGTEAVRTPVIAWLYVPSLMLHSFLFALKVYRFVTSPRYLQKNTLLWRFLKEGMGMYACALGSLLFTMSGLTMTDTSQIPVYDTALAGGVVFVALTVVSVCRAMLSIKSLAATVHVDPGWLLNHAELSRVHWRQGGTEGEIVVEILGDSYDLPSIPLLPNDGNSAHTTHIRGASSPSDVTISPG